MYGWSPLSFAVQERSLVGMDFVHKEKENSDFKPGQMEPA